MSDKYDAAVLIAEFFKDRKSARQQHLDQSLVQVWDEESQSMIWKRKSEAVGSPSQEKVNYANKLDKYVEQLDDYYSTGKEDYKPIEGSPLYLRLTDLGTDESGNQVQMTEDDYKQAIGYIDSYAESKSSVGKPNEKHLSHYKTQYNKFTAMLQGQSYHKDSFGNVHKFDISKVTDDGGNVLADDEQRKSYLTKKRDFYRTKLEEYGITGVHLEKNKDGQIVDGKQKTKSKF